jgi:hypothetical protein
VAISPSYLDPAHAQVALGNGRVRKEGKIARNRTKSWRERNEWKERGSLLKTLVN